MTETLPDRRDAPASPFPAATGPADLDSRGLVNAVVYRDGRRLADIPVDEAGRWAERPGHVVWIGLYEPSHDLLARVQGQFRLHPLAIEDAEKAHQQPKLEQYGDTLFVVARTAQMVEGRIAFGETHLFVGHGYVVTVRHGPSSSYAEVRHRCEAAREMLLQGEDYILYAVLDFIVDNYGPVLEAITEEVEGIEDRVLEDSLSTEAINRLYMLRRDLLRLRNAAGPLVDVCQRLEHSKLTAIDPNLQPLFRDVTDHIRRVQSEIDALREVLAFAFEAGLMVGQMQQTVITRQLAAWAAILAVPTAVAGIYGMNFKHMPELEWVWGYYVVIAAITGVCGTLFWWFRRVGWL
ncbi:magnesium and cobalt transport protein CorA [Rhodoplanes sp. TEM]|uniref:Magnesium and cobalt transport protein CorA n=1 Tax=Rhodoplanes tepidamans TaxID=200616 RepID=A0ABT5JGG4_RHOTP|nr:MULTISPECIES: magnesium and cobalt transport protein CorA [Rhodoplanes]MDC7788669.1 magnesium and cobalt transport protein CorA [Rhodoplanes tepidamans]MDC7984403.1 magnesium and cobalt transport protein CorA [Rhodoplanes sp. TEM]MDQ0358327.1 magnesium transporter [Rhodoplanes tepidamans]